MAVTVAPAAMPKRVRDTSDDEVMFCLRCKGDDHFGFACPTKFVCLNCFSVDHKHRDCPNEKVVKNGIGYQPVCTMCAEVGHWSNSCPNLLKHERAGGHCVNCGGAHKHSSPGCPKRPGAAAAGAALPADLLVVKKRFAAYQGAVTKLMDGIKKEETILALVTTNPSTSEHFALINALDSLSL